VPIIWAIPGLGGFLTAKKWGRLADRFGQRPILILTMTLKPLLLLVFLAVTRENAIWILPPAFFFDAMLNAGIMVGSNGYLLKLVPKENRSMFIAAATGLTGIAGGIGAFAGAGFLEFFEGWSIYWMGRFWNHYHLLFVVGIPLRMSCLIMALRISEPTSSSPMKVFNHIRGILRLTGSQLAAPFYRKKNGDEEQEETEE
jgi:MFS family permease